MAFSSLDTGKLDTAVEEEQSQSPDSPQDMNPSSLSLLSLPVEIRLRIYDLVFAHILVPSNLNIESRTKRKNSRQSPAARYRHTSTLSTCRQIYMEAKDVFRKAITYNLDVAYNGFDFFGTYVKKWEMCPDTTIATLRSIRRLQICVYFSENMYPDEERYLRELLVFIVKHIKGLRLLELTIRPRLGCAPRSFRFAFEHTFTTKASYIYKIIFLVEPLKAISGIKSLTIEPVASQQSARDPDAHPFALPLALSLNGFLRQTPSEEDLNRLSQPNELFALGCVYRNFRRLVYYELNGFGQVQFDIASDEFLTYRHRSLSSQFYYPKMIEKARKISGLWHTHGMRKARAKITRSSSEEQVARIEELEARVEEVERLFRAPTEILS